MERRKSGSLSRSRAHIILSMRVIVRAFYTCVRGIFTGRSLSLNAALDSAGR
jgi:hypothetical protein